MFKSLKSIYYWPKYIKKFSSVYSITGLPDEDSTILFKYMGDEIG